jgi:hypothetical protein
MTRQQIRAFGQTIGIAMPDADYLCAAERAFAGATMDEFFARHAVPAPGQVLLAGAGAGALPIGLARTWPSARILAFESHPALFAALCLNVAAEGLGSRIELRQGVPAGEGALALIRSRDAPDFVDLVDAAAIEHWMDPLPLAESPLPEGFAPDLILGGAPALLPRLAAIAAAFPAAGLVARARAVPPPALRCALEARAGPVLIAVEGAGRLAAPALRGPGGARLDVVVIVHGVEAFVVECVDSLLADRNPDIRVLAVDDGSRDASVARLRAAFGPDRPGFAILSKPRGGAASARNFGRRAGSSGHVAFVDGDDVVEPGFFSRLLDAAELTGLDVVQGPFELLHADRREPSEEAALLAGRPRGREGGAPSFRLAAAEAMPGQPAIWRRVYRRDFLDRHRIWFPEHVLAFDDQLFHLRTLAATDELLMLDGAAYLWRQRPGQDVRRQDGRHFHSLGMFRTALCEAMRDGWPDLAPLLAAMVKSITWSAQRIGEPLRPAYVRGAAELLAAFAKALGPAFPAAGLRELWDGDVREAFESLSRRWAGLPSGAGWAWLAGPTIDPALVRLAGPRTLI